MLREFEFTLILAPSADLTEDAADALFEAGCDDGSPGMSEGVVSIDFHRESESLEDAIHSAIDQVRKAGFGVQRAEIPVETSAMAV